MVISGQELTTDVAVEEGSGEGPNRTLSITTPSPELQPASSPAKTGTASASHRPIWRRSCSSATEHRTTSRSESAPEGRASTTETEQSRGFIVRIGLSWWIIVCSTLSSVQHGARCCGTIKTGPQAVDFVAICLEARSSAPTTAACTSRLFWWIGVSSGTGIAVTIGLWWHERCIQQPVLQRRSGTQALAVLWSR